MVRLIAALDEKRGIATDAGIPWELPTDQQYFVNQTKEGLILMGAGTYREFTKPMHSRTNYVVTHDPRPLLLGFEAVHDVDQFFHKHQGELIQDIGGASLFDQTLRYADELLLTQVYGDFQCTKFFPAYERDFELVSHSETYTEHGTRFRFETWRRKVLTD